MHPLSPRLTFAASTLLLCGLHAHTLGAQGTAKADANSNGWSPEEALRTERFIKPPANIERMIMTPRVDISFTNPAPDRQWFMRATGADRGDILAYGKEHIWLGGLQIDTRANRARSVTTSTRTGITLVNPRTGATKVLSVPAGATISSPEWSPLGTQIAYLANFNDASYVYVADVASGKSTALAKVAVNATLVTSIAYTADGRYVVATVVPSDRGPVPDREGDNIIDGPQVRLTNSRALPQPVHFSLLQDPYEKALVKYYTMSQLVTIDVKSKAVRKIGTPRMIRSVDASPDGAHFRVTVMTEPFSYVVPVNSFGSVQELWDASGKVIATLATTPLREGGDGPGGGRGGAAPASDTAKRNLQWNPVGPGMVYLQSVFAAAPAGAGNGANGARGGAPAGRGGAPGAAGRGGQAPARQASSVRYMQWLPPYGAADTRVLYEGGPQLSNVVYGTDGKTMFVSDSGAVIAVRDGKRMNLGRTVTLPAGGGFGAFGGRGGGAGGNDTVSVGSLLTRTGPNGASMVMLSKDGQHVAVSGVKTPGAKWANEAPRPWVDRLALESNTRSRVFESPANAYDEFVTPLDDDLSQFIYTHESSTVIPDAYLRDVAASTSKKITNNVDVGPEVSGAKLTRFQVTRPRDGYKFWVEVTMPRDWTPGTRLPGIIWFYPREYTGQTEYERSRYTTNINKFPEVPSARPASSTKLWVSQGYAFIEPDLPIFGDSGKMNDNYTRDLKENLDAVLDAVVDMGFVDRNKMGLGGHSYGAFSTVNAMTLVPYFKAGIAGDGMYNRTLTPFGFQSERRNFFQAQDTYLDMSPFLRADKISGALLMYHALEDQNQGTAPISSTRMYLALQGLGKPAALYMYPYEDHSVATYASDLDLWARWVAWMDLHVKGNKSAAVVP
ncbi:MAG: prolyl oligopeptidase family serine peptidase [Gemmatimonadaceae bacterium]|nr:prolyl oligopeptidase family serine peptidase [Gemmatimonadaceae bacterium]